MSDTPRTPLEEHTEQLSPREPLEPARREAPRSQPLPPPGAAAGGALHGAAAAGRGRHGRGVEAWETPLTLPGNVVGTPKYLAPELLKGQPADARSDLFALCVALYEALSGQPPLLG